MALSRYIHRELLDHLLGVGSFTPPSNIYAAAFTVAPNSQGSGGTEVSGNGYARVNHNVYNPATDADPAVCTNDGEISFPQATGSWGTIVHIGLYDAETGGNYLGGGTVSKVIDTDDQLVIGDEELDVKLGPPA